MQLLGEKYMTFDVFELERRLSPEDRELYKSCISLNANYDASTKGEKDLRQRKRDLQNAGLLKEGPMGHKIARLASTGNRHGEFYMSLQEIAQQNYGYVNFRELSRFVYDMLTKNPSKCTRVPYLYGASNSGKSCFLRAIEYILPTAKKNKSGEFFYDGLKGGDKRAFIWEDFHPPSKRGGDFQFMLDAFEGDSVVFNVKGGSVRNTRNQPVKFFVTAAQKHQIKKWIIPAKNWLPTKRHKFTWTIDLNILDHLHPSRRTVPNSRTTVNYLSNISPTGACSLWTRKTASHPPAKMKKS
jgi:hypothetical protein